MLKNAGRRPSHPVDTPSYGYISPKLILLSQSSQDRMRGRKCENLIAMVVRDSRDGYTGITTAAACGPTPNLWMSGG